MTADDPQGNPSPAQRGRTYAEEIRSVLGSWPVWLLASAVSLVVTFVTVLTTYGGFLGEALPTWSGLLLFLINSFFTVVVVALLSAAFKPERPWLYAVIVAVGFQTFIATDLAIQPLAGADDVAGESLNLGGLYNPVEKALSGGMDDPVEAAKRAEIETLRKTYPDEASLTMLRDRVEDVSATDGSLDATGREELMTRVDAIVAVAEGNARTKVRDIALECYARAGRDLVRDVSEPSNSPVT